MKEKIIYQDSLVKIRENSIILKHYYLPFISKIISFDNIETIETIELPSMQTKVFFPIGWRLFGLGMIGGCISWLPMDLLRPTRDKIFAITYKNQKIKSGFTVEDSEQVERILKEKEWLLKIFS